MMDEGKNIHDLAKQLWGINRSITGEGVRQTLSIISEHLPDLKTYSVKSGTKVFDWTIPNEWHVNKAYIISPSGEKICDFKINNLHLVAYSIPVNKTLPLNELQKHLYSLPDQLDAIPYVTSYYKDHWGFCISEKDRKKLKNGNYKIIIDSKLFKGVLNYGEFVLKGSSSKEIFLSTYICHPSMANNELSGPTVVTFLAKWLMKQTHRKYTYRIIFIPETIGSITYLSLNYQEMINNIVAGFNVSCVGDNRTYSFLPSRRGNTLSDEVAKHVLKWIYPDYVSYSWNERGSDEKQYCSPGINLPIASIMRTKYGMYPEYHTSLDNLEQVVTPDGLKGGYDAIKLALELLEKNEFYKITVLCDPQLGKRNLYPSLSIKGSSKGIKVMMDFISWCDGDHSLIDIAEKIGQPAWELYEIVDKLESHGLLETVN
jgi:aminopeptidase-like protein